MDWSQIAARFLQLTQAGDVSVILTRHIPNKGYEWHVGGPPALARQFTTLAELAGLQLPSILERLCADRPGLVDEIRAETTPQDQWCRLILERSRAEMETDGTTYLSLRLNSAAAASRGLVQEAEIAATMVALGFQLNSSARTTRTTQKGARILAFAHLCNWHGFDGQDVTKTEPIEFGTLATDAKVSGTTVTRMFKSVFGSYDSYRRACQATRSLIEHLKKACPDEQSELSREQRADIELDHLPARRAV
ncbi:MAG: hypothetical protein HYS13_07355 [Planctomycetia bacterium]|nr:hypothetical protein [Planctomycetia bacterium]